MKGIDVSTWQGNINWTKIKDKIDFAILRLGWIGNISYELDNTFIRNYNECKKYGIPVGVYVYNYAKTIDSATKGAKWVLKQLADKELELPVYLDMEEGSTISAGKTILTNICIAFNTIIESAGYWAGIYANKNWLDNYLLTKDLKKRFTIWIAHYGVSLERYSGIYDMLQYSSSGHVGDIKNVDMNVMYRDLISEIQKKEDVEEEEMIRYAKLKDVPAGELHDTIKKLINAGYIKGTEGTTVDNIEETVIDMPYETVRAIVICDRAYGK